MLKASLLALTCALAFAMATAPVSIARAENPDDVFLDEGDGDFGSMPVPGTESAANPEPKTQDAGSVSSLIEEALPTESESSEPAAESAAPKKAPVKKAPVTKAKVVKKEAAPAPARKVSKSKGAGHFMTTKDACPMMREPASAGDTMITVKPAKKIWVEEVDESWVRGFNKAGEPGYLSRDCF